MTPTLRPRAVPLEPKAVVALGAVAPVLARRLAGGPVERLASLSFVRTPELLLAVGPADALPWVPGVIYLGHGAAHPGLLLPTTKEPSVPVFLLERALRKRLGVPTGPLALVEPGLVVPLARATRLGVDAFREGTGALTLRSTAAPSPGAL
ncbi:MAG: hypothetical protein MUC96_21235 [Myxococcaceae bacterium]|jgi:hypothetical protein|nr:hypothetical protein [Myxococcaceae bacterium]